jgi:hypothetical protein
MNTLLTAARFVRHSTHTPELKGVSQFYILHDSSYYKYELKDKISKKILRGLIKDAFYPEQLGIGVVLSGTYPRYSIELITN